MQNDIPKDETLCVLAKTQPHLFFSWLKEKKRPSDLARVASMSFLIEERKDICEILIGLCKSHYSPLVREACLQGLEEDEGEEILNLLTHLKDSDPNEIIREIAKEMILERKFNSLTQR